VKIRSWPRDEKGHEIKPQCMDPKAIERDSDHNLLHRCRYRHVGSSTCYRRWAPGNGPANPCPVREMHMIAPRRRAEEPKDEEVPA